MSSSKRRTSRTCRCRVQQCEFWKPEQDLRLPRVSSSHNDRALAVKPLQRKSVTTHRMRRSWIGTSSTSRLDSTPSGRSTRGDGYGRGVEAAYADYLGAVVGYDAALVTLTGEVARAYVLSRTFERRLELALDNVEIQRETLRIAEVRQRFGAVGELDVTQARSQAQS